MKTKNKLLSLALAGVFCLLSLLPTAAASSETALCCTADNSSVCRGDTVTITVAIEKSVTIKSVALTPSYDTDVLELISAEWLIDGLLVDFDYTKGNGAAAFAAETDCIGDIMVLTFRVKEAAVFGETAVYVTPVLKKGAESVPCESGIVLLTVGETGASLLGDVDLDKAVGSADLTALARHVGGIESITQAEALSNADVTRDGAIGSGDLTKLARFVGGIDSNL